MEKTEKKYVNLVLAELHRRALSYEALSRKQTKSSRDRAIWRSIAVETRRSYNFAAGALAGIANSRLEQEQIYMMEPNLERIADTVSEEEFQEIVDNSYSVSELERASAKAKARAKVTELMSQHPELVAELKLILGFTERKREAASEAKVLGGFITAAKKSGLSDAEAQAQAQQKLDIKVISERAESIEASAEIREAIAKVTGKATKDSGLTALLEELREEAPEDFSIFDSE